MNAVEDAVREADEATEAAIAAASRVDETEEIPEDTALRSLLLAGVLEQRATRLLVAGLVTRLAPVPAGRQGRTSVRQQLGDVAAGGSVVGYRAGGPL